MNASFKAPPEYVLIDDPSLPTLHYTGIIPMQVPGNPNVTLYVVVEDIPPLRDGDPMIRKVVGRYVGASEMAMMSLMRPSTVDDRKLYNLVRQDH